MRSLNLLLAAATLGCASVLPRGVTMTKTVQGRDVTVTSADLDNFKYFSQYSAATYCNSDAAPNALLTCTQDACPLVSAAGARVIHSLDANTSTNTAGYIALDPDRKLVVLALRGSVSLRNWLANLLFAWTPCDFVDGCKLHQGWALAWSQISADVLATVSAAVAANPGYGVVVTGHSLGGAVATIAGANLRRAGHDVDVYTYGSPRVGNDRFVQWLSAQPGNVEYRVTHVDDPVPRLPPLFLGYRHVTPEYWLSTGTATTVDYTVADVKVCEGFSNLSCSASALGLDTNAHLYYLGAIAACSDGKFTIRDADSISDAELEQRLNLYAQMDREYAAALEAGQV